jgi:hypothetical protein
MTLFSQFPTPATLRKSSASADCSFVEWLADYEDAEDALGDFARDWATSRYYSPHSLDEVLIAVLDASNGHACEDALLVAEWAWQQYASEFGVQPGLARGVFWRCPECETLEHFECCSVCELPAERTQNVTLEASCWILGQLRSAGSVSTRELRSLCPFPVREFNATLEEMLSTCLVRERRLLTGERGRPGLRLLLPDWARSDEA